MIFSRDHHRAKQVAVLARRELAGELPDLDRGLRAMELATVFFGAGSIEELEGLAEFRSG